VRRTRQASPRLASQAPKVKIMRIRNACVRERIDEEKVIKNARERIMASNDSKAIKIW
jgi:hypothetical protein